MTYRVLRPRYSKTGETTQTPDGVIRWEKVEWVDIGPARDMQEAKSKYGEGLEHGRAPVLSEQKD